MVVFFIAPSGMGLSPQSMGCRTAREYPSDGSAFQFRLLWVRLRMVPGQRRGDVQVKRIAAAVAFCFLAISMGAAQAQTVEEFYKGKIIKVLVGVPPGGVYDISARLMARYLGNYI